MAQTKLKIKLIDVTADSLAIIYAACRQCYSPKFAGDIFDEKEKDAKKQSEFVAKVVASGHESPLEHAKFTFAIQGVSRALTHQLVRHRIASYSQQSQRYVKETEFDYIIPPAIEKDEELKAEFIKTMEEIQKSYNKMLKHFEARGKAGEKVNQDIRFVLPQAAETKIVVTMNCRELLHFFAQRCCARAQWEIKILADRMLEICQAKLPEVFSLAGAKCLNLGYCPEGEQFSCGKFPLKEKVLKNAS